MIRAEETDLSELERLEKDNCLIKLDYPYHPRRRPLDATRSKILDLIREGDDRYRTLLTMCARFQQNFEEIAVRDESIDSLAPRWVNGWFPPLDAITLYSLLVNHNPRRYIEIGSGNSTMFARRAIQDHGLRTSIVSVDPFPRANIDAICDNVIRMPCEDLTPEFLHGFNQDDILFVDNSHRSFQNSDVTVFFTEILPHLPCGIIYGIHDICLPWDYPEEWKARFYNEQYLLSAYLLGGAAGDRIALPNAYLSYYSPELLKPLEAVLNSPTLQGVDCNGGAFWMLRT